MSRRARRALLLAATAALVSGCSNEGATQPESPSYTTVPASTTTAGPAHEVTTLSTTPTTIDVVAPGPGPLGVEMYLPRQPVGAAVVVLVHGGGWLAGSPTSIEPLGRSLAERGAVVFNASYRTDRNGGGYPATFDDIACAVAFARHQAEDLGATGQLSLVGHSAGAHLAAVIASNTNLFGLECPFTESSVPDRVVGLAGIYRLEAVAPIMERFLGGDAQTAPEAWEAADPFRHLDDLVGVEFLLVHGTDDRIAPAASSQQLADALAAAGVAVELELIEGATHNGVIDPAVTADLVVP